MMTFSWPVDSEAVLHSKFAVRTVKFGDGYEQRQKTALRPSQREWSVSKIGLTADLEPIRAFLDARGGVEAFIWASPVGSLKVKVSEYEMRHIGADVWRLSWKFEEVSA